MAFPVIIVNSFDESTDEEVLMKATPENGIENRTLLQRFYNFNMVITQPFSYQDTAKLFLTDNDSTNVYHLIDRLGKPMIADELIRYAGTRNCLACRFDSVTNTIMVLSGVCPTDKYIKEWIDDASTTTATTVATSSVTAIG